MKLNGNTLTQILPLRDLYTVYNEHERLSVFVEKGRECVNCGRVGVLLLVTEGRGGTHVDLYTDDFVLMTVDHIVPRKVGKQEGWSLYAIEALDNKQPMCEPCNNKKGCKLITNQRKETPPRRTGCEIIRQLVFNENIFNRELEGVT